MKKTQQPKEKEATSSEMVTVTITLTSGMRDKWKRSAIKRTHSKLTDAIRARMQEWVTEDDAARLGENS